MASQSHEIARAGALRVGERGEGTLIRVQDHGAAMMYCQMRNGRGASVCRLLSIARKLMTSMMDTINTHTSLLSYALYYTSSDDRPTNRPSPPPSLPLFPCPSLHLPLSPFAPPAFAPPLPRQTPHFYVTISPSPSLFGTRVSDHIAKTTMHAFCVKGY